MREFSDIRDQLGLKKFLDSPMGTLYFVPYAPGKPRVIVRHFDSQLPVSLVAPFASMTKAAHDWLSRRPDLAGKARVVLPDEVGRDFIAREHFTYYTSTESYELDEEDMPPDPPAALFEMREAFSEACGRSDGAIDAIIESVLARSLIEPTGKTFYNESEGLFIIVELKPTRDELERWSQFC